MCVCLKEFGVSPRGEDTKEKVLKAATKLFSLNGFKETSIRDITAEAGVNVSAVNYYFESKDMLFREIIRGLGDRFKTPLHILKTFKSSEDYRLRLEMFFSQLVEVGMKDMDLVSLFFREQDMIFREMVDLIEDSFILVRNIFVEYLDKGVEAGIIDSKVNTDAAAKLFFHNLGEEIGECPFAEVLGQPCIKDENVREQWIEDTMYLFWKAIRA